MTGVAHDVDEDAELLNWLASPVFPAPSFRDNLHSRLTHVAESSADTPLDFAVLFRQLLRRWSLRDERPYLAAVASPFSTALRVVATTTGLRETKPDVWSATDWTPGWLPKGGVPDDAALAGTVGGERARPGAVTADPFFTRITGFESYRTPGQRAACRAVVSVPAGTSVIAMLPTGSGKTEAALCLAQRRKSTMTLVIVPTVALAYDFERRFRDHYARMNSRVDPANLHFAWSADTDAELRSTMRQRILNGVQPLLVTSPESVTRSLRGVLSMAAETGRLGGIVIDEAHLVTQWGRSFRPEFRTLSYLRSELITTATDNGHQPATTLLLSATLGSRELRDLRDVFSGPGETVLVAANTLRPEPAIWIGHADNIGTRRDWVMETLAHVPRPAILYVTSPAIADGWLEDLRQAGYQRLALVTGKSSAAERAQALSGIRGAADTPASVDLVVATSAFGLGIDYPHIRTVVHACLPETVDRWYQELGRGGRDGAAAAEFLLTAPKDRREADQLSVTVLSADTARKRWTDLWEHRAPYEAKQYINIEGARGAIHEGSYNRRWNAQLVQGLVELDALDRKAFDVEGSMVLKEKFGTGGEWLPVELRRADLDRAAFWQTHWTPWQMKESRHGKDALATMLAVASGAVRACDAIAYAYRPDDETRALFGPAVQNAEPQAPCGRCPGCRNQHIAPPDDPPPSPRQSWPIADDYRADLERLAQAAGSQDRLIVITADDPSVLAQPLADRLIAHGVRHVAGLPDARGEWLFVDPRPIGPLDAPPCSSLVVHQRGDRISPLWLSTTVRPGHSTSLDILLVPTGTVIGQREVGRDIPALAAVTALILLGG